MSQPTDRELRSLLAGGEVPEPPAGLAARIKSEIPPDLSANIFEPIEFDAPARVSPSRLWLMAASIIVAVGAGLFVSRQMDHLPTPESSGDRSLADASVAEPMAAESTAAESTVAETVVAESTVAEQESEPTRSPAETAGRDAEPSASAPELSSADGLAARQRPAPQDSKPVARSSPESSFRSDVSSRAQGLAEKSLEAPGERQTGPSVRQRRGDAAADFTPQLGVGATQAPARETQAAAVVPPAAESARFEKRVLGQASEGMGASQPSGTEDQSSLSFSLEIGTASYTLTRKLLREGQLPPPEAIRPEEFVNGFKREFEAGPAIDSPEWAGSSPAFRLTTLVSEFAEVLARRDRGAIGSDLEDLRRRAQALSDEPNEQPAAEELLTMVSRVLELVGSQEER